jgi:hypothetical protein
MICSTAIRDIGLKALSTNSVPKPMKKHTFLIIAFLTVPLAAQDFPRNVDRTSSWLIYQAIPSFTWTSFSAQTNFAFEWEVAPLVYSWGMTNLVSPWSSFIVTPTRRFTGSVELVVSAQAYTSNPGVSHFGYSAQLLSHFPLVEMGEHLTLNVGAAQYVINNSASLFYVLGASSLFGMLHYNVKYSPDSDTWINALEVRLF